MKLSNINRLLLIGFVYCHVILFVSTGFAGGTNIQTNIQSFAGNGFEPEIYGIRADGGVSTESILKKFGKPPNASKIIKLDREPDVKNEFLTWEYPGLIIIMYRPIDSNSNYYWISEIKLSSPDYSLKYGLKIGSTKEDFLKQLEKPHEKTAKSIIFTAENYTKLNDVLFHGNVIVTIEFDQGNQAKEITWNYVEH